MSFLRQRMKILSVLMALIVLLSSCASTTLISTEPSGATLYIDGVKVGETPLPMTNTKTVLECSSITIEKEGYRTVNTTICRSEEIDPVPIIGGFLFIFPFLWAMKYYPEHNYTLQQVKNVEEVKSDNNTNVEKKQTTDTKTKYELLRELKQLLDDGIITQQEFEKEKKRILDNE